MSESSALNFKIADQPWEMDAIHRLNYRTFSEEIPQHTQNEAGVLIDKFHAENTYVIALKDRELVGMVALRGKRPFSLDQKVDNLDENLPLGHRWCEIRLLAVEKNVRNTQVTVGLLTTLAREALRQGYDGAVISGTTRQIKLYTHMGFEPFGELVGSAEATFQPMYLSLEAFQQSSLLKESRSAPKVNLLPGPVAMKSEVVTAFAQAPESHRGTAFLKVFREVRRRLCQLVNSGEVQILTGSGTLANEAIAAQIKQLGAPGIIVSQGEFGERLVDHANRMGLKFHQLRLDWGQRLVEEDVTAFIQAHPEARWLWTTHCETSTSMLNSIPMLRRVCDEHELKLCLDCISTIGVVPVDLGGVWLASGSSGKGLASFPGLALVFHHHAISSSPTIPRYLDLGLYATNCGVPFTVNSNLLHALHAALQVTDWKAKAARIVQASRRLRQELSESECALLGDLDCSNPAVITLKICGEATSRNVGWKCCDAGFHVSYQSNYLLRRNLVQICLMGEFLDADIEQFLATAKECFQSGTDNLSLTH